MFKKLLIILPFAVLSLGISDCSSAPILNWDGVIYVGSSEDQAVIGKKDGSTVIIPANSPEFDGLVCTDKFAELERAYKDLIGKCREWER